jgi:hypothetical protein
MPFLWYCDQIGTVHTWHHCICKLESSSCDTVISHSIKRRGSQPADAVVSGMYCSILITVSQEGDSNLHESPSSDTVIRMEHYIPDTPAYVNWNSLLVILWSEWNSTYLTPLHMKHPNLQMQWCQVCTVPFWSQYHKKGIPTYICRGVGFVLFHSDHSIKRRGTQYIPDTPAYVSWNPLLVILWSEWSSTYLTPLHM